jgi:type I restriction enzyme, S subunit
MVPEGWNKTNLGELVSYKKGFAFDSSDYSENGVRVIRISDTTRDGLHSSNPKYVPESKASSFGEWKLDAGDIIVSTVGSRPHLLDSMVGKAVRIPSSFNGSLLNQNLVKLTPRKDQVISEVLYPHLKDNRFITFISGLVRGNANQVSITLKELFQFPVLLPPLPEQRKIADILSTWDSAIEKTEALLATAKAQKRALMQSLLTGKRRFPQFEGQPWKEVRASEVFETVSIKRNEDEPLLAVTQDHGVVRRDELERRVVMPDGTTAGYKLVVPGNFIISLRSFQGGLEYSSVRGLVSPAYHVLQPTCEIDDAFYEHYFKSYDFIGHLAVAIIGIRDGKQISYKDFSFLKIPLPSLIEQRVIGRALDVAAAEIKTRSEQNTRLRAEKKALMQQLLTGKRRVQVEEHHGV